jgi:phosphate transport system permease protein
MDRCWRKDRLMTVFIAAGSAIMFVPVFLVMSFVIYKGAGVITPHFFTETAQFCGQLDGPTCGGISHAIVGTLEEVGTAVLIAVPLAVLCAVFMNEIGGPLKRPVRLFVDAMSGVPSIVAGLFIYTIWVVGTNHGFSGFGASLALSILMLPTVTRTADETVTVIFDHVAGGSGPIPPGGTWEFTPPHVESISYHLGASTAVTGILQVQQNFES